MPTYDYACPACGGFDAFRALAARNEPAACPDCGAASPRVFASAPRLALLESGTRRALDVNERARHEPKRSSDYAGLRHPAGCGCCTPGARRSATVTGANGAKAFPSKRPWMISH
ncbi:MAG: zinc ribbon domain-containing protein [Piscinibacter sp.]|nr:zinc ribbon domain-containing protein [Piscinibacter sp.]